MFTCYIKSDNHVRFVLLGKIYFKSVKLGCTVQYNHVMATVLLQHQHLLDLSSTLVRTRTETLFQCVSIKFDLVCMHSFFIKFLY